MFKHSPVASLVCPMKKKLPNGTTGNTSAYLAITASIAIRRWRQTAACVTLLTGYEQHQHHHVFNKNNNLFNGVKIHKKSSKITNKQIYLLIYLVDRFLLVSMDCLRILEHSWNKSFQCTQLGIPDK